MRYVTSLRKFLAFALIWWVSYRAVTALDFWLQTDRGYKGAQIQIAVAAMNKGSI